MTLVSVIMPYYNKRSFFKESIQSVFSQTYKNLEIIIIYDQEDQDDLRYIKKITKNKKNVFIIKNNKNIGVARSRNNGIKKSKGEFIAFIDCDDIWKKNKIKDQLKFMISKDIKFSHTSYCLMNEQGKIFSTRNAKKKTSYNDLIKSCDIALSSVILRREIIKEIKFPNLKTKEDYALWLKLSKKQSICGLKKILLLWRKTNKSLSSSVFQKLCDGFRVYYIEEKFNFFYSLYRLIILSLFFLKKKTQKNYE